MKNILKNRIWIIVLLLATTSSLTAQDYDILVKGGHVIDSKNNLDQVMDVAIKDGKIAKVDSKIPENQAKTVIDAKGLIVAPGLLDIHGHNFFGTEVDA